MIGLWSEEFANSFRTLALGYSVLHSLFATARSRRALVSFTPFLLLEKVYGP